MAGPPPAAARREYRVSQSFGDSWGPVVPCDVLSALGFDESGQYIATGDTSGRMVVFESSEGRALTPLTPSLLETQEEASYSSLSSRSNDSSRYRYCTEFQSHEKEFDTLKSLEIKEKINCLQWCRGSMSCKMLLTANDKTIKLWKIYGKSIKAISNMNVDSSPQSSGQSCCSSRSGGSWASDDGSSRMSNECSPSSGAGSQDISNLRLPKLFAYENVVTSKLKCDYGKAHAYHLHSLASNSDGESFLSCDELHLNMWNLHTSTCCFNVLDVKPPPTEQLSEVITSADFHPSHCQTFLYASSQGKVRVGDMRASAWHNTKGATVCGPAEIVAPDMFDDVLAPISCARFSPCGRYVAARDFMHVHLWDLHNSAMPFQTYTIHDHLRPLLWELYDNDHIMDKFELSFSHDSRTVLTGTYGNRFNLLSVQGEDHSILELSDEHGLRRIPSDSVANCRSLKSLTHLDFSRRICNAAFHPREHVVAAAATSSLFTLRSDPT